jgi:hypothetical protein
MVPQRLCGVAGCCVWEQSLIAIGVFFVVADVGRDGGRRLEMEVFLLLWMVSHATSSERDVCGQS